MLSRALCSRRCIQGVCIVYDGTHGLLSNRRKAVVCLRISHSGLLRAMSIEALAHELIGHQEKSKRLLESGNIDAWLDELSQELRLVEQLRARLLNHSIVVTDDPAVKQVLNGIDLTEIENFDKVGSELLYSWISPAEYGARFEQIYQHYRDLCKVVHGLSTSATSGALGSLTKTIGFVQYLYEQHKVPIKSRNA